MFHGFKPFHMRWNKYNEINEYCCCLFVYTIHMRGGLWNVNMRVRFNVIIECGS